MPDSNTLAALVLQGVGAVDNESGNFVYFDSQRQRLGPEHVMASGALPPSFPAVVIESRAFWDGGLVSNTPLRHIVKNLDGRDATIFQVDLFSARGRVPRTRAEASDRDKTSAIRAARAP